MLVQLGKRYKSYMHLGTFPNELSTCAAKIASAIED